MQLFCSYRGKCLDQFYTWFLGIIDYGCLGKIAYVLYNSLQFQVVKSAFSEKIFAALLLVLLSLDMPTQWLVRMFAVSST